MHCNNLYIFFEVSTAIKCKKVTNLVIKKIKIILYTKVLDYVIQINFNYILIHISWQENTIFPK